MAQKAQGRAPGMDQQPLTDDAIDAMTNAFVKPAAQAGAPAAEGAPAGGPAPGTDAWVDAIVAGAAKGGTQAAAAPAAPDLGGGSTFAHHLFSDIPIAGPVINGVVQSALAATMASARGTKYEDELAGIKARDAATEEAHPTAAGAGSIGGQALGIGMLGAAAPMALGVGMDTLGQSAAMSGATMGLVNSIDAAVRGEDPLKAGVTGALGGMAGPYISSVFTHGIAPRVAQLYQIARQNGIEIPAGLVSNNPILRWVKGLPGGTGEAGQQAASQLRQAVVREIGGPAGADGLTPEVMTSAKDSYGPLVAGVAQRAPDLPFQGTPFHKLVVDLLDDIRTPTANSPAWGTGEQQIAEQMVGSVLRPFQVGTLGGPWRIEPQQYLKLTNFDNFLYQKATGSNANLADVAVKLKNGLDDLLEANLPRDAVDDLKQARRQWWALKSVEPLADKYRATGGIFQPEELAPAVAANTKNYAYGGGGNLAQLGEIGATFLKGAANPKMDARTLWQWVADLALGAGAGWLHSGASGTAIPIGAGVSAAGAFAARTLGRSRTLPHVLTRMATDAPTHDLDLVRAAIQAPRYIGRGAAEALGGAGAAVPGATVAATLRANNPLGAAQQPAGQ